MAEPTQPDRGPSRGETTKETQEGRLAPPPGPLSAEMEGLEASIRLKMDHGEPLTHEERMFFARMPADKGIPHQAAREDSD